MVKKSKLIGQVNNGLLVIDSFNKNRDTFLIVKCEECGKQSIMGRKVYLRGISGCENCGKLYRKQRNTKGYTGTKLYSIYTGILRRTEYANVDISHKKLYKDRNIKMCEEWQKDFTKFYEWAINNGYKENLTIDRIDNDLGYSPSNCRWVTIKDQANNRRNNKIIEINGIKKNISQWTEYYNIPKYIVYNRLRAGWEIEDVFTKPIDITKRAKGYKDGNNSN